MPNFSFLRVDGHINPERPQPPPTLSTSSDHESSSWIDDGAAGHSEPRCMARDGLKCRGRCCSMGCLFFISTPVEDAWIPSGEAAIEGRCIFQLRSLCRQLYYYYTSGAPTATTRTPLLPSRVSALPVLQLRPLCMTAHASGPRSVTTHS